jgi:hypothetical protein
MHGRRCHVKSGTHRHAFNSGENGFANSSHAITQILEISPLPSIFSIKLRDFSNICASCI